MVLPDPLNIKVQDPYGLVHGIVHCSVDVVIDLHVRSSQFKLSMIIEIWDPEAAVRRCSSNLVFLKILQYSQENASVGVTYQ